ncbi:hypothetical protein H6G89_21245 [Oscillatoria sp. FACHB-1407]|uniref:hypothetical protein n=1 Tax=Oscillatoria sp. FACHB-1407 TaxID=2692847 RepID=UPI001683AEF3|nr:hypothetical protein [Oscillatoria sp. FACHB-1407]MBD2463534.1 hypothetical protein [Oscillatoria sp. FACHB-1407]
MNQIQNDQWQWNPALCLRGEAKTLAVLLVRLEEIEEQLEDLQQQRSELLSKIFGI